MGRHQKLLQKAINNPIDLSFSEFKTMMERCGWLQDHQKGSHQIWYSPKVYRISVQPKGANAKGYPIKQFLERHKEEAQDER